MKHKHIILREVSHRKVPPGIPPEHGPVRREMGSWIHEMLAIAAAEITAHHVLRWIEIVVSKH